MDVDKIYVRWIWSICKKYAKDFYLINKNDYSLCFYGIL